MSSSLRSRPGRPLALFVVLSQAGGNGRLVDRFGDGIYAAAGDIASCEGDRRRKKRLTREKRHVYFSGGFW